MPLATLELPKPQLLEPLALQHLAPLELQPLGPLESQRFDPLELQHLAPLELPPLEPINLWPLKLLELLEPCTRQHLEPLNLPLMQAQSYHSRNIHQSATNADTTLPHTQYQRPTIMMHGHAPGTPGCNSHSLDARKHCTIWYAATT